MSTESDTTALSVAWSPLFKLPPELRNYIYEFAVNLSDKYGYRKVTKEAGIPEPPLLSTCKAIRKEAIGIFYANNKFRVDVHDFDPAVYHLFVRKDKTLSSYNCRIGILHMDPDRHRRWGNLLRWLRQHHAGNIPRPRFGLTFMRRFSVLEMVFIETLFMITSGSRGRPWDEVRVVLMGLHYGLRGINVGWDL